MLCPQHADDSKPYPTQPNYQTAAGNQPAPPPPEEYKTFDIGNANVFIIIIIWHLKRRIFCVCLCNVHDQQNY